ncbi:MAG: hypothetical protein IPG61_07805 [bacterium]|nr:hypothetical protein [bacterium]
MTIKSAWLTVAALLCAMWAAQDGRAYVVHLPDQEASAIAEADVVVVGRLLETLPFDERVPLRKSPLVVDQVFAGDIAVGDTLQLPWSAREWHPAPDYSAGATEEFPRAGDYAGTTALWVLEYYHGDAIDSRYKYPGVPFVLSLDNRAELDHLLVLIEERLSAAPDDSEKSSEHRRIEAVAHRLREFLEERHER